MHATPEGMGGVMLGKLPDELVGEEVEFNIIFLEKNNYCYYYKLFNLQSYRWMLNAINMNKIDFANCLTQTWREELLFNY